jgi:MtN3 and saliva related transmembrane protein
MVCQATILGAHSLFSSAHAQPSVLRLISLTTSGQKAVDNSGFFLRSLRGTIFSSIHRSMDKSQLPEIIGIAAGICTAISLLPQIIKVLKEKKAQDISLFYLLVLLCGLTLWTYYGFLRDDIPIIATNMFSVLLNIIMLILGIVYKRRNAKV